MAASRRKSSSLRKGFVRDRVKVGVDDDKIVSRVSQQSAYTATGPFPFRKSVINVAIGLNTTFIEGIRRKIITSKWIMEIFA